MNLQNINKSLEGKKRSIEIILDCSLISTSLYSVCIQLEIQTIEMNSLFVFILIFHFLYSNIYLRGLRPRNFVIIVNRKGMCTVGD